MHIYNCYAIAEHAYSSGLRDDGKDDGQSDALQRAHIRQKTTEEVTSTGKPHGSALTD